MNAEPQNIEQANFEGRRRQFGVRMFGVLRFVIQPFFPCSGARNLEESSPADSTSGLLLLEWAATIHGVARAEGGRLQPQDGERVYGS